MDLKIGERFVMETGSSDFSKTPRRLGEPAPAHRWPHRPGQALIALPKADAAKRTNIELFDAIVQRTSVRAYSDEPLSLEDLAYLLFCTQGIIKPIFFHTDTTHRTAPSAGARHPLETVLYVRRVAGLAPGLYRYDPYEHALLAEPFNQNGFEEKWAAGMASNRFEKNAAVSFVWAAVPERVTWHHAQRGYRNLFVEAGHLGQNLYLAAQSIGCGACTLNVFEDAILNELCGLDGYKTFAVYAACVGKLSNERETK